MAVCQLLNYLKVPLYLDCYNLDMHNFERKPFFPFGTKKGLSFGGKPLIMCCFDLITFSVPFA